MLIRFRTASWSTFFWDLVIQPGFIAAVISAALWLTIWMRSGSTSGVSPSDLWKVFLGIWAGMAILIFIFSVHRLVPEGVRWLEVRRKETADERVRVLSHAMVDEAVQKAPLMLPAIRAMPHLNHICRALPDIDVYWWERSVAIAMISIGKAGLIDKTDHRKRKDLSEYIDSFVDARLADALDEFPSHDLEDFEAEIKDELLTLEKTVPTLSFSDQFNFAVGQRICTWSGIAQAFPVSDKSQEILFYMTLGKSCAGAMARYL